MLRREAWAKRVCCRWAVAVIRSCSRALPTQRAMSWINSRSTVVNGAGRGRKLEKLSVP